MLVSNFKASEQRAVISSNQKMTVRERSKKNPFVNARLRLSNCNRRLSICLYIYIVFSLVICIFAFDLQNTAIGH